MARTATAGDVSPFLPIAVRAYTEGEPSSSAGRGRKPTSPRAVLVFDCETTIDETQRLLFGSYRYLRASGEQGGQLTCAEEGVFFAPGLSDQARCILARYVRGDRAEVSQGFDETLHLRSLDEFLERVLWRGAWRDPARSAPPAAVVGFNLPFDLSRLARAVGEARGARRKGQRRRGGFVGGFSFDLYSYRSSSGEARANSYRPRVAVKTIDSKRHLLAFIPPETIDQPELFDGGFRGHFLDLRTLAFALSDRGYSLAGACEAWGVEDGKLEPTAHGEITAGYVDYNRQDVKATAQLYEKLIAEYRTHPIELQPTRAYSPASIGKAYLRAMGVRPALDRQQDFPPHLLGWAMSAYYGGRAECRIRRAPVPVVCPSSAARR